MSSPFSVTKEYYYNLPAVMLSVVGCLFVVLLFTIAKPLRIYAFRLVFWLAFFDLIKFSCLLVPIFELNSNHNTICGFLGFIYYFSLYHTFIWALAIAITLYQCLILEKENLERFYKYWLGISFFYSTACAAIPLSTNSYGFTYYLCELKYNQIGGIYKFTFFYIPLVIEIFVITYIYGKIYYMYSLKSLRFERELSVRRLLAFPAVMAFCALPAVISDGLIFWNKENQIVVFCAYFLWSLHGFFNAVAYAMTRPVIIYLRFILSKRDAGITEEISMFDSFDSKK